MGSIKLKTMPVKSLNKVSLRPAVDLDMKLLFLWVNTPENFASKIETSTPIVWADHIKWFKLCLESDHCAIWIAEKRNHALGQVRVERHKDGDLHIDIYVDSPHRVLGIGTGILNLAKENAKQLWPGEPLVARVKKNNTSSLKLFQKCGFKFISEISDYIVFVMRD